ncbi:metal ABC transporter permease [Camelimonas lactis]|uniref:Manganese/iron transport system permease protein n=1 Tax=Camelimonas lactis TaxID=659006 RepID=A0A4R2GV50_9HYPH|nr:metal ABC transporter permease [Camelimonas lactis]TCO13003.1 manganese/iron transport system permease protein [Camelimonas lactis]
MMDFAALSAFLAEPFSAGFMRQAFLVAQLVAIPTALLSCFMVLRGWALLGDAISHAVFPGVVIAYILGVPFGVGAFAAGMGCALAAGYLQENSRIRQDTLLGVVFAGMFGLGLVLYRAVDANVHLEHILFGDLLGVGPKDLALSGAIAALVVLVMALRWRDLALHAFDPVQARVVGLPVRLLHYGLLALISLAIVGALSTAGLVLAIALLIAPGAIGFLLTRRLSRMLPIAVAANMLAALAGVFASYHIDSAPGPTIVLCLAVMFIAAMLVSRWRQNQARAARSADA